MKSNGSGRAALMLAAGMAPRHPQPAPLPVPLPVPVQTSIAAPPVVQIMKSIETSPLQPVSASSTVRAVSTSAHQVPLASPSTSQTVVMGGPSPSISDLLSNALVEKEKAKEKGKEKGKEKNKEESVVLDSKEPSLLISPIIKEKGTKASLLLSMLSTPQQNPTASDSSAVPIPLSASVPTPATSISALSPAHAPSVSAPVLVPVPVAPMKGFNATSLLSALMSSASKPAASNATAASSATSTSTATTTAYFTESILVGETETAAAAETKVVAHSVAEIHRDEVLIVQQTESTLPPGLDPAQGPAVPVSGTSSLGTL